MPKIGDERFLVEMIDTARVEALARKRGWKGGEGLRECCEPEDTALYTTHKSLAEAVTAAKEYLAEGTSFYGCTLIDHEVYEQWHDDRGNRVKGASWERQRSYEVAMDGEPIPTD
jgi:hypothetical protein